jgi:hypothetical protein
MGGEVELLPLLISVLGIAGIVVWLLKGPGRPTARLIVQIGFFLAMTAVLAYTRIVPFRVDPGDLSGANALLVSSRSTPTTERAMWCLTPAATAAVSRLRPISGRTP